MRETYFCLRGLLAAVGVAFTWAWGFAPAILRLLGGTVNGHDIIDGAGIASCPVKQGAVGGGPPKDAEFQA